MIFATLTAPSFGAVHSRATGPGRAAAALPSATRRAGLPARHPLVCTRVHDEGDPCLGEPLCRECFDYDGALLWNNLLGELWRRTTIYLPRKLARLVGITQKRLSSSRARRLREGRRVPAARARARARGDPARSTRCPSTGATSCARPTRASPSSCSRTRCAPPPPRSPSRCRTRSAAATSPGARSSTSSTSAPAARSNPASCAGYLAKYATKATEQAGGVLHRVTEHEVDQLPVREHVKTYLRHAFALDAQLDDRRLARNAHAFGYRGHCLTKSRRFSTTFKQLRADREAHVLEQILARSRDESQLAIAAAAPEQRRGSLGVRRPGPSERRIRPFWPSTAARGSAKCAGSPAKSCATNHQPEGSDMPDPAAMNAATSGRVRAVPDRPRGRRATADRAVHGPALLR